MWYIYIYIYIITNKSVDNATGFIPTWWTPIRTRMRLLPQLLSSPYDTAILELLPDSYDKLPRNCHVTAAYGLLWVVKEFAMSRRGVAWELSRWPLQNVSSTPICLLRNYQKEFRWRARWWTTIGLITITDGVLVFELPNRNRWNSSCNHWWTPIVRT